MKKESIVWLVGCLFISLFLMSPLTSLADDKNEENYKELKSKCEESPCQKFDSKFKPELKNKWGTLLFKDLSLGGSYGITNTTSTFGLLGQFGVGAEVERKKTYGILIAYKDKPIMRNIWAFIQKFEKYDWKQELLIDPFKLNADISYGKVLETKNEVITSKLDVKTTYNATISYCLPIEKVVYYLGWLRDE